MNSNDLSPYNKWNSCYCYKAGPFKRVRHEKSSVTSDVHNLGNKPWENQNQGGSNTSQKDRNCNNQNIPYLDVQASSTTDAKIFLTSSKNLQ